MKTQAFERLTLSLSILVTGLCLFVPLIFVSALDRQSPDDPVGPARSAEVTVGIAVILRATARRLIRSGAKGVMRTTLATVSRTVARTVVRRLVRFFTHSVVGLVSKRTIESINQSVDDRQESAIFGDSCLALLLGFVALCLSFWGVLTVVPPDARDTIIQGGVSVPALCLLAGLPLVLFGFLMLVTARWQGVSIRIVTEFDGLLIQGYFTGAGSFLPMATDFECEGTANQKTLVSGVALGTFFVIHLLLLFVATTIESAIVDFSAGMFLVYSFVYAFPINPLPGHDLWARSRLLWLGLFVPILVSFLFGFPPELSLVI